MLKKMVVLVSLFGFTQVLIGCNTVEGVGKDVEATGKGVEKASKDVQKKL